jgi:hypothetical protein
MAGIGHTDICSLAAQATVCSLSALDKSCAFRYSSAVFQFREGGEEGYHISMQHWRLRFPILSQRRKKTLLTDLRFPPIGALWSAAGSQ